jgi:hypothetical protein
MSVDYYLWRHRRVDWELVSVRPHRSWRDLCWKCEDGYPYPHRENDEAERHSRRMEYLDSVLPIGWDLASAGTVRKA